MIKIYTDGSCFPNPGLGAWAWAISKTEYQQKKVENTTNNRMELQAILEAICYAKTNYPRTLIEIHSDSMYCVQGFNSWMLNWQKRGWKKKGGIKNLDLWQRLFQVKNDVNLVWVKGHNGDEMNEFVDGLANELVM